MKFKFKMENKDVNKRKEMSEKLRKQFPDKIPIICEKDPRSKLKDIEKTKYLMPKDLTVSQFHLIIRNKIELNQEESLCLLVDGKISLVDLSKIVAHYGDENRYGLTGYILKAADMNFDEKITLTDVSQIVDLVGHL